MANFDLYVPTLSVVEGGFSNHPDDFGKMTMHGVTLATYQAYCGKDKTIGDLKNMSHGTWRAIMKDMYWDKCRADEIDDQKVAEIIADWCVNSGYVGIKKAQEVIGVKPDGVVGPITLSRINSSDARSLHDRLWQARYQFYHGLVAKNPSQKVFLKGWLNRLGHFKYD
jgi:lysozyme family protein